MTKGKARPTSASVSAAHGAPRLHGEGGGVLRGGPQSRWAERNEGAKREGCHDAWLEWGLAYNYIMSFPFVIWAA